MRMKQKWHMENAFIGKHLTISRVHTFLALEIEPLTLTMKGTGQQYVNCGQICTHIFDVWPNIGLECQAFWSSLECYMFLDSHLLLTLVQQLVLSRTHTQ